jgi:nucleoside-diphosphate-sugar epimerase
MFHHLYRFPIVMTRIFMVYGPGQPIKTLIPHSITRMLPDETLSIGSPERKVDWIYGDDLVRGLLAVASTPGSEENRLTSVPES